jgi:hypothetical protein
VSDEETEILSEEDVEPHKERKFIVFVSSLLTLLSWCCCPECGAHELTVPAIGNGVGTLLRLTLVCRACDRQTVWNSQPFLGRFAAGNVLLSAAILFAGSSITKVTRVPSHMGVSSISPRTFFRHQSALLQPVIRKVWADHQRAIVATIKADETPMVCGGDGRADSPGHSAKYGTYTLIELQKKVVVDLQLVQVK